MMNIIVRFDIVVPVLRDDEDDEDDDDVAVCIPPNGC